MSTLYAPQKLNDLTSAILNFRGTGVAATASAGSATSIDYQLTEDRILTGGTLILQNHAFGDNVDLQVIDKDGILFPPGTVLNQFATSWYVAADQQMQHGVEVPYPAKILQGLYIRVIYHSTGLLSVNVHINFFMHKILS